MVAGPEPLGVNSTGLDKRLATLQTLAYLESLRFDRIVARESDQNIFYYRLID